VENTASVIGWGFEEGPMSLRRLLPWSLMLAIGGCSGSVGTAGGESTADLKKVPAAGNAYTLFETLQVRPLALSPDGNTLFAVNTPDNRLEMFHVKGSTLRPLGSVVVGLEPVAVAARTSNEVWVVNHLSDSVSIVKVGEDGVAVVTRTLLVGDEPRDIVFAGPNRSRAFITTAHRGQNTGDGYDLQTAGVGRADVWVFDANNLGAPAGGARLTKLTFFADTPRALAVSADGNTVYAAAFASGNMTTAASPFAVANVYDFAHGGHMPGPATITLPTPIGPLTIPMPPTGLIVRNVGGGHWMDAYGKFYDPFIKVKLPDLDVFAIDASGSMPVAKANGAYAHVGTTLFNMAVNPKTGKVYVTNTDAHNDVRFEGHNAGFTTVRGHIVDSRISTINPGTGAVTATDLNSHLVGHYEDATADQKAVSVAFPQDVTVSRDGSTLYTVMQGSGKLAIYSTAEIESGSSTPNAANQIALSGGGPTGVVINEGSHTAFVLTRFDNSISAVDLGTKHEVGKTKMFNPEPASVTNGRKYLYDATATSSNGTQACASCHIGGDKDELAWDLGNPGGIPLSIRDVGIVFTIPPALIMALLPNLPNIFANNMPVKGPMTTQSLRGMDNHGAMHWRGDRNGMTQQTGAPFIDPATSMPVTNAQPNSGIYNEVNGFKSFNVAFPGLLGNGDQLSDADMTDFTTFILQATYPPNPVRNLDGTDNADQAAGRAFYFNHAPTGQELPSDRFHNCNGCHTLDKNGNAGATAKPGFFGSDGRISFEFESQVFKVPHLRNMYTKVGMFGSSLDSLQPGTIYLPEQQAPAADAVRGFGYNHDGVLGQLEHFFTGQVFLQTTDPVQLADGTVVPPNPFGIPYLKPQTLGIPGQLPELQGDGGFELRRKIVAFMMAFDSNLASVVGQQITMTPFNTSSASPRLDLLEAQATAGSCDLVAKSGAVAGVDVGFLYGNGAWQPSSMSLPAISDAALRALVARGATLTFTCVPPGEGVRVALDRDGDGYADADELLARTNPSDPTSHP
jgi:DNA-binding beta-propeller fold protein YncE